MAVGTLSASKAWMTQGAARTRAQDTPHRWILFGDRVSDEVDRTVVMLPDIPAPCNRCNIHALSLGVSLVFVDIYAVFLAAGVGV